MDGRIAVIWNPSKTERATLEEPLRGLLDDQDDAERSEASEASAVRWSSDVHWEETSEDDPGRGATRRALAIDPGLILVAGGDGTVRAVAEEIADSGASTPLGIVPLGTGNLLARNLSVPLNDVRAAMTRALSGASRPVDVGWVDVDLVSGSERHAFVVMIGFGIDAHMIAETDEELKSKAGWLAYVESLGRAMSASEVVPFHLTVDEEPARDEDGHTLLIANCGSLQGGFTLLPDADPSDGQLDFLLLSAEGIGQWVGTFKTMVWDNGLKRLLAGSGEPVDTDSVSQGRARRIEVTLPSARPFEIDGEDIGEATAFSVTIQPAALQVR